MCPLEIHALDTIYTHHYFNTLINLTWKAYYLK